ncbi:MAG: lipoyl synthase [Spirochaetales bacterium]|nr:lipoyl synthase [Spirochaetales bacterium]
MKKTDMTNTDGVNSPNKNTEKGRSKRLPPWIKRRIGGGREYNMTSQALEDLNIQTICTNANCPNQGECWERGTATVLILGNICTRNCPFCAVGHGKPEPPDPLEPKHAAELTIRLGIRYLVLTSVDRDDLSDGGAAHFRNVMLACRERNPEIRFELLVPDFKDCQGIALDILDSVKPFVFGHNIETVPELYKKARPGGDYQRSLDLLSAAKSRWPDIPVKSSLMLGLGETDEQVLAVLKDLRKAGCDRLALGQYLRPSREALEVSEYITPEKFDWWKEEAEKLGFSWVMSSPFTRSSYHAES